MTFFQVQYYPVVDTVYFILKHLRIFYFVFVLNFLSRTIFCAKLARRGPASGKNRSSAYLLRLPEAGGADTQPCRSRAAAGESTRIAYNGNGSALPPQRSGDGSDTHAVEFGL